MAQTYTDIIISGARVFYAPVGETLPDETSVAYGGSWGGNWTEVGFTSTPVSLAPGISTRDAQAQQRLGIIAAARTDEQPVIETTLMEITADHLDLGLGGTVSTTAAGASQVGYEQLVSGSEVALDERAWGFEGLHVDSSGNQFPVRVFAYRAYSVMNGNLEFNKESESGIPLQIKVMADTSKALGADKLAFQRVTAAATS